MDRTLKHTHTIWSRTNEIVLCLMVFTLPINLFLNNLFLSIFLGLFGLQTIYLLIQQRQKLPNVSILLLVALNIPVILLLFGMTYSPEYKQGLKDLGRLFPIILISVYVLIRPGFFDSIKKQLLASLIIGCVVAALLCWGLTIAEILQNKEPLSRFFSSYYASHTLAEQLGVHTPYLALFVNMALGSILYAIHSDEQLFSKKIYVLLFVTLSVFLFHLMARNAIFSYLIFGIIYLVATRKFVPLTFFAIIVLAGTYYIQTTESNVLRDRFINSVNVFENETIFSKKDNRFDRLNTNFEIFKKFPIIGPGTANEDQYRKQEYFKNRDSEAYNDNYNAHNQFMEYLSTYGVVGGIAFICMFLVLYNVAVQKRDVLMFFFVSAFFIANLSESMLERSWGIVFFITILILSAKSLQRKHEIRLINPEEHV